MRFKNIHFKEIALSITLLMLLDTRAIASLFDPDSPCGEYLKKTYIDFELNIYQTDNVRISYSLISDPQEVSPGTYLRPYALKNESEFWKMVQRKFEPYRISLNHDAIHTCKYELERGVLTISIKKQPFNVNCPNAVSINDFEDISDVYQYLGRAFTNHVHKLIHAEEDRKTHEKHMTLY